MSRPGSIANFRDILAMIREQKSHFAVTTDIICGFPGETDEHFQQSLSFVEACQFSGGHVFPFSELKGTAAFGMEGQVQHSVRKVRTVLVRKLLDDSEKAFINQRLGKPANVLFEGKTRLRGEDFWQGWSEDFLRVFVSSREDLHNQIRTVRLNEIADNGGIIATS